MTLSLHRFSIRDYTSKMRSLDVFKCWPFAAAEVSRQDAESWLPPITVPKSRWCSDELAGEGGEGGTENRLDEAVSQSDDDESESTKDEEFTGVGASEEEEKMEMVCPVCRDFNAATLTAVNAHIDGCLAQTMREERRLVKSSKWKKATKRRSIAEIFELKENEEEEKKNPPTEFETVLKLLPFDAEEVSVTLTKFRWISRRLEVLRSNRIFRESAKSVEGNSNSAEDEEKSEMLFPVCSVSNNASASATAAANAHIDGCLAKAVKDERWKMRKRSLNPKPKAPKKRSIAEILTMAPQIESKHVAEAEEEDEGEINRERFEKSRFSDATNSMEKIVTRRKKKMKKVMNKKSKVEKPASVVPLSNESKKMKKKQKTTTTLNKEFTAKKEDAYKRKMQNPVYSSTKLDTIGNKKVKLDDNDASSAHEKKLGLKILSEEKKEKVKNCDSVGKQQKAVSPIRGILKNLRHISVSTSSDSNIQDGTEESRSDVQVPSSDSHVRFSAQDSILTPKNSNSLDETVFNSSSESQRSTGSHEGTVNLVENRNDEIAINTDNRKGVCNVVQSKQLSNALGPVSVQNFLKPCTIQEKSKHLAGNSESLSKVAFCDLHQFDKGNTYADFCRPLPAFQAGQTSVINTQACESEAFMYTGKSIDHFGDPAFQSATVHSNASTRTYLEPSPSYSATSMEEKERPGFPFHAYGDNDNNGQALGGRSWAGSGMFSVEKMDTFHLPGCGKGNIRNNCKEQNFFGLPLNSHGELINFSSSGNVGMNQPNVSSTLRGSLSGLSVNNVLHQNSQENLSVGKRHVFQKTLQDRVNPLPYYTGRFGVTELQGKERTDIYQQNSDRCSNHYVQLFDSELNRMRDPFIEQNPPDKVPNHKEYGMVSPRGNPGLVSASSSQPTMRLMGKDVPIGISSKEKQQFVGGVLWTDEESKKQYSVDAAKDNAFLGRGSMQDWVSGSILQVQTENVLQPVKILSNQALQSTFLVKGQKSEFHNLQNALISQNGSLGVSRNATSNLHPVTQASTSCEIYNMEPHYLSEQYISGAKPQGLCFQSTLTNAELNDRKKHQHFTNSAFSFPFLHPVVEEQAKTSWCKSSYGSLPPGSLGSTYERLPGSSCSVSSPQTAWGNKFTIPSMNHSADVLSPPNAVIPHCPRKSHLCPASIAQPPHVSITTVTKPPSAMNSGFKNIIKVTDGVKLEDMTAIDYHAHTNSRKRPAANNLVDRAKPNKLPNIEVQRNSSHIAGLGRETSNSYLQRNTRAVELDLQVGARSKSCQNEAQKVKPRSYTGFDSFGLDGMVISGPVKLTPGAKHILEPPQNMDQDNPRPIHSAIPIAATTDFGRDLELQSKLKKMYRF